MATKTLPAKTATTSVRLALESILARFEPGVAEAKKTVMALTAATVKINTPNEREALFNLALGANQLLKGTDKARTTTLAPLSDLVKGTNAFVKSKITEPVEAAIAAAKVELSDFDRRLAAEQEAERIRLANEKQKQEETARLEAGRIATDAAKKIEDARLEAERIRREEIDSMEPGPEKAAAIRTLNGETEEAVAAIEAEAEQNLNHNEMLAHTAVHAVACVEDEMDSQVGRGIVQRWKFTVVDALAFANARPDLVKIEAKTREVNSEIAAGVHDIPGLLIEPDNSVALR